MDRGWCQRGATGRLSLHYATRHAVAAVFVRSAGVGSSGEAGRSLGNHLSGLRHSFVAILLAASCDVLEVSEWAGHHSVAFTLSRYGGLFEDRLD
jgi:site-specific recombinase XerC